MYKRTAILKLEHVQWSFENHCTSQMPTDLYITDEFMQLLTKRIRELVDEINKL